MGTSIGTPPDYYLSRQSDGPRVPPHRNSYPRVNRKVALLIIACGLSTFFTPLVTIDPPVGHKGLWSACDVVLQVYKGILPRPVCERCDDPLTRSLIALPFFVTVIYLLMLGSLIFLFTSAASRTLTTMAGIGAMFALGLSGIGTTLAFHGAFYGSMGGPGKVHYGWLQLILFCVMAGLSVVCLPRESST